MKNMGLEARGKARVLAGMWEGDGNDDRLGQ